MRVDTSDNVEISTGTGSGTTRFGIASNGDISFYNTGAAAKFFWDASAERLGVGTATPSYSLDVNGTGRFSDTLHLGSGTSNPGKLFISDNSATNYVMRIQGTGTRGYAIEGSSSGAAYNLTLANENVAGGFHFTANGRATFNENGDDWDFRVEGDTNSNALFVRASDNKVGIGTNNPVGTFHISDNNTDRDMDANGGGQLHIDGNGYGFGIALNSSAAQIYTNTASRDIVLGTDETEKLRINNAGTLLLQDSTGSYQHAKIQKGEVVFQSAGDVDLIIAADTDNSDENHNPRIILRQDGTLNELVIGSTGATNTPMTGVVNNGSYIQSRIGGQTLHLGTGTVSAIDIDSNQRVRMPKQPRAWMAKNSAGSQTINVSGSTKISMQTATVQNGMSFSSTNNRLTVPATGNYLITAMTAGSITSENAGDGIYMRVYKNGSAIWSNYQEFINSLGSENGMEWGFTDSYVVPLSANDYLEIWLTDTSSSTNFTCNRARLTVYMLG